MAMVGAGVMGGLVDAANQGMFAVDTVTGATMSNSIGAMHDQVIASLQRIQYLKTEAKLGDMPEALRVAQLNALVAAGDPQSLQFVLQRFAEALERAEEAVRVGMRNYEQVEQMNAQGANGIPT